MVRQLTFGRRLFAGANYLFLAVLAAVCLMPLISVLAVSFSEASAITSGQVKLWPVGFTFRSYSFVATKDAFLRSMLISLERVGIGTTLNMLLTVLVAYPLSKERAQFRFRTMYAWVFVFTMLFSGGLIPTYIVVKELGLLDSIWALVLPGALPIFNAILLLNFFRGLPKELIDASLIDGAGQWQTLWRIVLPLSMPALATITLFSVVGHWNEWFNGLIYMNAPEHYPLASYLQTVIIQRDLSLLVDPQQFKLMTEMSDRGLKAAQIFLGAVPVFVLYPFLQRYFMSGIVMGSVKE
ncbi:MAG: carbohydrate ABC transporter permease [Paenibacillaceae bacterium]|uniref:carbohydrate ABC transporter permease n=1 Tax=Paenibacillus cymbidii TaxID=1639034 RepID=UPI001A9AB49B|nr:carbohydrate ABC transporter permease [Paenibacillus cymbidii]MBO9607885.1 carbohydrate ABC transporter permease [Paenibacillaceae bacterium]